MIKKVVPWILALSVVMSAADGFAQSASGQSTMTGFTRNTVTRYKVTSQSPFVLEKEGSYDAKDRRGGLSWEIVETLSDGRVIVKTPEGLAGFEGTQVKTDIAKDAKNCTTVASLGVKSRNLSSQGLNECPSK